MTAAIIPAAQGWHLCTLNSKGDGFVRHPVIAWHVFENDLPPTPVLAWGTQRPDPYALHFEPGNKFYVRGKTWQIIEDRDEAIKRLAADA
ncbi:hypothetical protein V5279_25250 [Bradyrhizobium sp. 26S5]|uniref:hypothetical protein n=1 Tax=Bradyrhizobium sp. 26S5 TaxID=3139729 RepID=UPI0030D2CCBB